MNSEDKIRTEALEAFKKAHKENLPGDGHWVRITLRSQDHDKVLMSLDAYTKLEFAKKQDASEWLDAIGKVKAVADEFGRERDKAWDEVTRSRIILSEFYDKLQAADTEVKRLEEELQKANNHAGGYKVRIEAMEETERLTAEAVPELSQENRTMLLGAAIWLEARSLSSYHVNGLRAIAGEKR